MLQLISHCGWTYDSWFLHNSTHHNISCRIRIEEKFEKLHFKMKVDIAVAQTELVTSPFIKFGTFGDERAGVPPPVGDRDRPTPWRKTLDFERQKDRISPPHRGKRVSQELRNIQWRAACSRVSQLCITNRSASIRD